MPLLAALSPLLLELPSKVIVVFGAVEVSPSADMMSNICHLRFGQLDEASQSQGSVGPGRNIAGPQRGSMFLTQLEPGKELRGRVVLQLPQSLCELCPKLTGSRSLEEVNKGLQMTRKLPAPLASTRGCCCLLPACMHRDATGRGGWRINHGRLQRNVESMREGTQRDPRAQKRYGSSCQGGIACRGGLGELERGS